MPTIRRAVIVAAVAALSVAACSSDDDDEPDVSTLDVTTLPDNSVDASIPDITLPEVTLPDVSIPDLSIPDLSDITVPENLSIPENAEEAIRDALEGFGLTDDQVDCLAERVDIESGDIPEPNDLLGFLEECGIELTDLQPG